MATDSNREIVLKILGRQVVDRTPRKVVLARYGNESQRAAEPIGGRAAKAERVSNFVSATKCLVGRGRYTKFADASLGFACLRISGDRLSINFVKAEANGTPTVIYEKTRKKNPSWRYHRSSCLSRS